MSGPWDKYQETGKTGPWAKYATAEPSFLGRMAAQMTDRTVPGDEDVTRYQRGVLRGMRDPIDAGAQLLTRGLESVTPGNTMTGERERVEQINREGQQTYQAQRGQEGFDLPRTMGNVIGTLPVTALAGPTIAGGAVAGTAVGALQPVEGEDFWTEKAKQMALGGAAGAGGAAIARVIGRMLSPRSSPQVQALLAENVTPTPGQALGGVARNLEEKGKSVPVLGDMIRSGERRAIEQFNRAALNRVLAPLGDKLDDAAPVGREAIASVGRRVSDEYDNLLPQLTARADQQFLADMANLRSLARNMLPARARQFESILNDKLVRHFSPQTGTLSGEALQRAKSELGRLATDFRKSVDADQRLLGDALREADNILRGLVRRSNPAFAGRLANIDTAYANLLRVENAAARTGQQEGVFSPAALTSAVRSMDRSMRHRAFARGDAPMQDLAESGKAVLSSTVPNSGTTDRAAALLAPWAVLQDPRLLAVPIAGLPYTSLGQPLVTGLLARRGPEAALLSDVVRRSGPLAAPIGYGLLNP